MDRHEMNLCITRPYTMWLGTRCFRVIGDAASGSSRPRPKAMIENMNRVEIPQDNVTNVTGRTGTAATAPSQNPWNIKTLGGVVEATMTVPKVYHGYICGLKNHNRDNLEKETKTKIVLPKFYADQQNIIVVIGESHSNVESACVRISLLVMEKRSKSLPTHFISIPANAINLTDAFLHFKTNVMKYDGMDELLFQSPLRLHLTLGMITILDISEQARVLGILQQFVRKELRGITKGRPLKFRLRGVKIMHDDPYNTEVLYANVEEGEGTDIVKDIAHRIKAVLEPTGCLSWNFSNEGRSDIKFHVTLMNAKFKRAKLLNKQQSQHKNLDCSFDASQILKNFEDYDFGWVNVERLLVAVCGSVDRNGCHNFIQEIIVKH